MCSKTSHQLAVLSLVWSNYLFRSKHSVYFPLPIIFSYQFNPNFPGGQIQALLKHRLEEFKKSYNRKGAWTQWVLPTMYTGGFMSGLFCWSPNIESQFWRTPDVESQNFEALNIVPFWNTTVVKFCWILQVCVYYSSDTNLRIEK